MPQFAAITLFFVLPEHEGYWSIVLQKAVIEIINGAADRIDMNYDDLKLFNRQNMLLSLQRAKTKLDVDAVKKFYGIPN